MHGAGVTGYCKRGMACQCQQFCKTKHRRCIRTRMFPEASVQHALIFTADPEYGKAACLQGTGQCEELCFTPALGWPPPAATGVHQYQRPAGKPLLPQPDSHAYRHRGADRQPQHGGRRSDTGGLEYVVEPVKGMPLSGQRRGSMPRQYR